MKTLITGSHGLIGTALISELEKDNGSIFRLIRDRDKKNKNEIYWNPRNKEIEDGMLEGFDAVVHFAGEPIGNGRWTNVKKKKIYDSRVQGTKTLTSALQSRNRPPKVFISASAMGYYGDRGEENLSEQSSMGEGFLAEVCKKWEAATDSLKKSGTRVVNIRSGMVLSSKGGVLEKILPVFKWGVGGKLGSGHQIVSWISLRDHVRAVKFLLENEKVSGPVNLVSPNPVTNERFTKVLGQLLNRPTFFSVPAPLLKLVLGEMAEELLLVSARGVPDVLVNHGFRFHFPEIKQAFKYHLFEE